MDFNSARCNVRNSSGAVTLVLFLHIDEVALPLTISTTFMIMARKNVSPFLANYPLHSHTSQGYLPVYIHFRQL